MSNKLTSNFPHSGADIHPWMPTSLHNGLRGASPLGEACVAMNVSIHDREAVYEQMKLDQLNIIKGAR